MEVTDVHTPAGSRPRATGERCPLCEGPATQKPDTIYFACGVCGHQFTPFLANPSIVNEKLNIKSSTQWSLLERYKASIVKSCHFSRHLLLDVGSSSGRFIYLMRDAFENVLGVEVNQAGREFARKALGLNVMEDLALVRLNPSVVTFWHSLEHFQPQGLHPALAHLNTICLPGSSVVIAVPNGHSWQIKCFGRNFTYYDSQSHYHQFTPQSLDGLMQPHGFRITRYASSPVYSIFGILQSFLNLFNRHHDYLYYRLRRGEIAVHSVSERWWWDVFNMILLVIFIPISIIVGLIECLSPKTAAVLVAVYERI